MSATAHAAWCDGEHDGLQMGCVSPGVEIGPLAVWLARRDDQSVEVVMDTPRAGVVLTPAQAQAMATALVDLVASAATARPAWATETIEPDPKSKASPWHQRTITVGETSINVEQIFDKEGLCPALAVLNSEEAFMTWNAQQCRDLAAALLAAATILDNA